MVKNHGNQWGPARRTGNAPKDDEDQRSMTRRVVAGTFCGGIAAAIGLQMAGILGAVGGLALGFSLGFFGKEGEPDHSSLD
ncbi:hypothetical protein Pan44_31330 [Caulifigura coniformis]|uniref:Uncharacterized protein n=1 Tax=Caulifigura coniformis TaxID=2527983 RepID=A0A517SG40_9PLAN|nr:hypothetical protein Pan44_31330 [Caulifigura coniformis]